VIDTELKIKQLETLLGNYRSGRCSKTHLLEKLQEATDLLKMDLLLEK
jgi:hypothetical protein